VKGCVCSRFQTLPQPCYGLGPASWYLPEPRPPDTLGPWLGLDRSTRRRTRYRQCRMANHTDYLTGSPSTRGRFRQRPGCRSQRYGPASVAIFTGRQPWRRRNSLVCTWQIIRRAAQAAAVHGEAV